MADMIRQSIEDRPVYFAMTTAAFEELRLRPYLIRQGVAYKLNNGPVVADSANGLWAVDARLAGTIGPFLDVARTDSLVNHVFQFQGGFPDKWTHWVDSATEGIPFYYGYTYYGLANAYAAWGEPAKAEANMSRTEAFLKLGSAREEAAGN